MQLLAKLLALYLFLGSLSPRTDFAQLTKIQYMVAHFQLHVKEARATGTTYNVLQFINDHFISPDGHMHKGSKQPHKNLPFASIQSHMNFIPWIKAELPSLNLTPEYTFSFGLYSLLHFAEFLNSVFHPPAA